jgi:DNA polymerase
MTGGETQMEPIHDHGLPPDLLRRQIAQHLESLRSAGVEWLPNAPPLTISPPATQTLQPAATAEALFGEPEKPISRVQDSACLSLEQRRTELQLLAKQVSTCMHCPELVSTRSQTVFADGRPGAELCLVGEAPGADEDAQGLPFVGAAGQLLNRIIIACGLKREEVYICNVIKCRPPGNRTPKPEEVSHCREYLTRQLELVQPKFICCLGRTAAQGVLNTTTSLERLRGRFHDYNGIPVLCTYHPSFLLPHRQPEKKKDVWEDMQKLIARMGRTIPPRTH